MLNAPKVTGWLLLFSGLIIIGFFLYYSYNIFTAKIPVPEIFKTEAKIIEAPEIGTPEDPQAQMQAMLSEYIQNMLPENLVPQILNLISWSIFAGISFFGGSQIASLGIKLIKE